MCRLTVQASSVAELSALGAVQAGLLGMSLAANLGALSEIALKTVNYDPTEETQKIEAWYQGWQAAVQRVL
jgi:glycerol kinase